MKSISGQTIDGSIIAENEQAVVAYIREKGHYTIKIEEKKPPFYERILIALHQVSSKETAIFCRQFSAMIDAGIPLMSSLRVLIEQTKNPKLKTALEDIYMSVQAGASLSKAMNRHFGIFPEFMINMVTSAEKSGTLDIVMNRLAVHFEKDYKFKEKVNTALAYPIVVIVFSFISLSFILTFVLPSFINMFETMKVALPLPTLILVKISNFIGEYGWYLTTGIILTIGLALAFLKQPEGRRIKDFLLFHMPVFGDLKQKAAIARFSRTLASLIGGGVPIIESIEIAKKTFGHYLMTQALTKAQANLIKGAGLAASLKQNTLFPPMVTQMIAVGEETGNLDKMLEKVADFYDSEVDDMLDRLSSLLEPMLIGVLGLIIGLIIFAVMLPVFEMVGLMN